MKTKKFGDVDPVSGKKWGGSPLTHWRYLIKATKAGSVDIPCGGCSACCRSGVPIYEDNGSEVPKRPDGTCVHLTAAGLCDRHATRPDQCRMFTCTTMSIGLVVTDNPVMNEAIQQWEWDLSRKIDRDFADDVRRKEAAKTQLEK